MLCIVSGQDFPKTVKYLSACIKSLEEMRLFLAVREHYKIGLADENVAPYLLMVSVLLKYIEMAFEHIRNCRCHWQSQWQHNIPSNSYQVLIPIDG